MNWINNLFYMGLFTALTGSIAFAVYAVVAGVLDGLKKYRYIYGLLLVVLPFWLFPGLFLLLYVTHYRKMGEALFIKGHLFELTPVIAHIECVAAVVWLLGAATVLVLHLVRYYRVEHYIKKHRMPAEKRLQLVAAGTKERLKIRGNVEVYCCYGISSPMVLGLFHKWIVLPVRDFSPESLQIVLTHEFVHVRQHILTLKCVGRVLEDLFWYNPLIYIFNRRLDFWSEMACDMECCRDSENVFSVGQYFRAALELLTEETRPLEFPFSMFGAQNHLQERIRRMKQYRKQKEMKPLAVLASFILVFLGSICFTCGAGIGTQKAVQKIYAKTVQQKKVNVQMEVMDNQVCYATQIETDPDARHSYMVKEEPYDVYKQAVMDAFPEDITEDSIKLSAEIPKQTLCKWAVKGKPQKISITVDNIRADKTICVGILTSAHKRVYIEANGEVVLEKKEASEECAHEEKPLIHNYTLKQIYEYAKEVPAEEIEFIKAAYDMNYALFEEGIQNPRTTYARYLLEKNGGKIISDNELNTASLLCNAAIEARVIGLDRPAMSITGSGAHGIIATMPLYGVCKIRGLSDETLYRATALSYLICMYIKEYSGKLSAFCGCGIAAGTGMACALVFLHGGDEHAMARTINNMSSSITGMICHGGNKGCTMKGVVAVNAAFQSADFAMHDIFIDDIHGINGFTPEDTMRHMGEIASPGMIGTEKTIVDILQEKGE